jgi:ribosomal protein L40E
VNTVHRAVPRWEIEAMFCHHCGSQIADDAQRCIHCGSATVPRPEGSADAPRQASPGMMFCRNCAAQIPREAYLCVHCGVRVAGPFDPVEGALLPERGRSWLITFLLAVCFGPTGFHRFYTGHIASGVVQLCTLGGFFVWWLVDVFRILGGSFRDAEGRLLVK